MEQISKQDQKPDTLSVNLRIGYKTIFLGIIITLLINLGVYYISRITGHTLQLRDYIALFSAGVVTTALVYTALGLKINYNVNREKLMFDKEKFEYEKNQYIEIQNRKRREFAYQVSSNWFNNDFAECVQTARHFLKPLKGKLNSHQEIEDYENALDADLLVRKSILSVLNYFEYVSILIEDQVIDEDAIKDAFKTLFCDYYKTLKSVIEHHQRENHRYFKNYACVSKRWTIA
ncbi:MAG: DUF4760 domain-containing protein [Chitinophagaceae bacterium]|nr:MAG: DUF4760 domain-containing protein [Chitinophagaceae bacterium]